jgi:hypothetical protein
MSYPVRIETETEAPLRLRANVKGLAACTEALLGVPDPGTAVEVQLVRSLGQGGDYAWLGFVTFHESWGWERNGVAVEAPGLGAGRRLVFDLDELNAVVEACAQASANKPSVVEWHADHLVVGDRRVAARAIAIPPIPDIPPVRDAVYLGGRYYGDVTVESAEGRIRIPAPLVAHLIQRGAAVAELGVIDGDVYVIAQSERRGEASTDPVIVAPVDLLMWSPEAMRADFHERRRQGGREVEQLLAALEPATPVETLLELLDTGVAYVRRRVAAHPSLPATVTDSLVESGTRPMRMAVAANPSLSPSAVELLAQDPDPDVRSELASNPALDPLVVRLLAADPADDVRTAVAVHPMLPPDVRAGMADDAAGSVRAAVAGDPGTPADIVAQLTHDEDVVVSRAAASNPACPASALEAVLPRMPLAVLGNPSAPASLLVDGARAVDGAIRAAIAANPSTPSRVLTALSRDPDARVLRAVVMNPRAGAPARRRAEKRVMTDTDAVSVPESVG